MGHYDLQYPKAPFSTVKRDAERADYALRTIHHIINSSQLVHVSFIPPGSPFPMILPMIGQLGSFDRPSADEGEVLDLYLHGYVSSRMMNLSRAASGGKEAEAGAKQQENGMPVTIEASHVDGLVLALSPFAHSYNYRSAVLFGHAQIVEDEEERLWAMKLLTDCVVPGRWDASRVPPTKAELQSTSILRVKISNGSAKIRQGGPHDDRADMKNEEVLNGVWTGIVPVHTTFGAPIPGSYNRASEPEYLTSYVSDSNDVFKEEAMESIKEPAPKPGSDD